MSDCLYFTIAAIMLSDVGITFGYDDELALYSGDNMVWEKEGQVAYTNIDMWALGRLGHFYKLQSGLITKPKYQIDLHN